MFSSLKYVAIKLKDDNPLKADQITTRTVLDEQAIILPAANVPTRPQAQTEIPTISKPEPAPEQVTKALLWLGKQSLEEFKMTYPPRDNAYYYFNRLLEIEPDCH